MWVVQRRVVRLLQAVAEGVCENPVIGRVRMWRRGPWVYIAYQDSDQRTYGLYCRGAKQPGIVQDIQNS